MNNKDTQPASICCKSCSFVEQVDNPVDISDFFPIMTCKSCGKDSYYAFNIENTENIVYYLSEAPVGWFSKSKKDQLMEIGQKTK
jgi:hypothetical protein